MVLVIWCGPNGVFRVKFQLRCHFNALLASFSFSGTLGTLLEFLYFGTGRGDSLKEKKERSGKNKNGLNFLIWETAHFYKIFFF